MYLLVNTCLESGAVSFDIRDADAGMVNVREFVYESAAYASWSLLLRAVDD